MLGNVIIKNRKGASLALTDKISTLGAQRLEDLWVVENAITAERKSTLIKNTGNEDFFFFEVK